MTMRAAAAIPILLLAIVAVPREARADLRADGSIVVWDPTGLMAAPPAGSFTRIASSLGYSLAIDTNGLIYGWGVPGRAAYTLPPSGTYSEIAAGTGRASAIAARH